METDTEFNLFRSKFPRSLLNEVKWRGYNISDCKISYINRGSPGDVATIDGSQIKEIDSGFLILEGIPFDKYIPYHRIVEIYYKNRLVFQKP